MAKRIVLTAAEIDAVLAVAQNALVEETFEDAGDTDAEVGKKTKAYHSGIEKLRLMLAQREDASAKRKK